MAYSLYQNQGEVVLTNAAVGTSLADIVDSDSNAEVIVSGFDRLSISVENTGQALTNFQMHGKATSASTFAVMIGVSQTTTWKNGTGTLASGSTTTELIDVAGLYSVKFRAIVGSSTSSVTVRAHGHRAGA